MELLRWNFIIMLMFPGNGKQTTQEGHMYVEKEQDICRIIILNVFVIDKDHYFGPTRGQSSLLCHHGGVF